jgi:crossover junction endodeoxyribonuclease RuvC
MTSKRIVAIDPSINGTCCYDGADYLYIKNPGSSAEPMRRLDTILDEISRFVWAPGGVASGVWLEDYAFSRAQHAHAKGELGGGIRMYLYKAGIPTVLVKPNSRAKFATGKGNAGKSAVVSAVSARTGIQFETDDHCDAFVLWCMAMEADGFPHPMAPVPKANLLGLDKVSTLR